MHRAVIAPIVKPYVNPVVAQTVVVLTAVNTENGKI